MGSNTTTSMFETSEMCGLGLESLEHIILVQMFQKWGSSTHLPVLTDQIPAPLFSGSDRFQLMTQSLKYFSHLKRKLQSPVTPGKSFQRTRSRRNILLTLPRGLTVNYNCSLVTGSSDFTKLNLRNGNKTAFPGSNTLWYFDSSNDAIGIYNQTNSWLSFAWEQNLEAVMEFGFSSWPKSPVIYDPSCSTSCYYNARTDVAGRYPAFDQELAVEAIL
jgi:hypothetical protein